MATQDHHEIMDPESQFLMEMRLKSKRPHQSEEDEQDDDEFEWDNYKENVRPLKRGRNIKILNESLKSHSNIPLKHSLLLNRRKLIAAIDEYEGDDPLQPWLQCIKWVQEAFPAAGYSSGLLVIYEQCVRTFWHDDRYRDDLRYLSVWLEYAENCEDAEVIYRFLDANNIGQSHSVYYISYALYMESKHKIKTANEVFNQGVSINAQPHEKLEAAYRKFLARSMGRSKASTDEHVTEDGLSNRSFGTVLSNGENRRYQAGAAENARKSAKGNKGDGLSFAVYKDTNVENSSSHRVDISKVGTKQWDSLATHKDRNKENKAIPAKWTSYKVMQGPGSRLGRVATPAIEVFVDEECSELQQTNDSQNITNSQLKDRDEVNLKRETELLKENPLRNFPASSFPR
ncbi:mitotic spindle checkpoint protein BUBR1 [Chenopodium quinoa]|uniref:mitotic spindle checkpoint protein BUBR1 n=1 Tax=Chenopodium quinoa TaxID=63459 RepID=UPI000B76F467|nr:mitotic spindle checkpoint protein BUBR1 [Chenopodium quinoa]